MLALVVDLLLLQIGLRIQHGLLRCLDLLLACAGKRESQIRLAYRNAGLVHTNSLPVIRTAKTRQQSALLHLLALFDGQIGDAALDSEADKALVGLDVSGKRELICGSGLSNQLRVKINPRRGRCGQQDQYRY